ncbi:MAG: FkbM family methyltransferase [Sulfuricurvum sp.]
MPKIAIFGAGAFGKIFYQALGGEVNFFIDDFSMNKDCLDIPIKKTIDVEKETIIYISVLQFSKRIEDDLIKNKFLNVINFTNSIKTIPNILNEISKTNYLWLVKDHSKMLDDRLYQVKKILKDTKSKEVLEKIIMLRKTLDSHYYIDPYDKEYFPSDVPILENISSMNFVDCGAYTGDSIKDLMFYHTNINYCLSFEPDTKNLNKLHEQLQKLNQRHPKTNFFVYPAGVYSSNTILSFSNIGIDSSACFSENSDTYIPVVTLDSVILNSHPTYIKMDIEGAEKEAILGATQTIQKYKPNLAICLYHKPEDLWEIPLLIHQIEPSYDMYLRVHEDMCLSTVLYCIKKEI